MSEDSDISYRNKILAIGGVLIVLLLAIAIFTHKSSESPAPEDQASAAPETPGQTPAGTMTKSTSPLETEEETSLQPVELDKPALDAALKERVLGEMNAPVMITEHSSLTCSHCGDFHKNNFKAIKEAFIDNGKAKLVFSDFPLNGPALQASAVARCVPEDKFFDFVQLLFETQEQWAYSNEYKKYLKQNAMLTGLSEQQFENCFNSEALKSGILGGMQRAQKQHAVNSTPTFIINSKEKVEGERTVVDFQKAIDKATAK